MDWRDRWIHFKIRDIYHPDPATVLIALHGDDLLRGKLDFIHSRGITKGLGQAVQQGTRDFHHIGFRRGHVKNGSARRGPTPS
jgi:hypothetical protein